MAAMTPRRVLGQLDSNRIVHTPPVAGKQPLFGSSDNSSTTNNNIRSPVKRLASPATVNPALLSPMTTSPYVSTPSRSLTVAAAAVPSSTTVKRSPDCSTLAGHDGRSPKRRRGVEQQHGLPAWTSSAGTVVLEQSDASAMARRTSAALNRPSDDVLSSQEVLKNSPSLSALFDTTMDSQSTSFTELAEDISRSEVVASDDGSERRPQAVRFDGARQNAEALRLRLRMAMYKVRTNQISLPLSQLSIISETARPRTSRQPPATLSKRTPLPTSLVPVPNPSSVSTTPYGQRPQSRSRPSTAMGTAIVASAPSPAVASPPASAGAAAVRHLPAFESPVKQRPRLPSAMATTPILPRLWRGEVGAGAGVPISAERGTSWMRNDEGEWEMELERDLTSSVVKGRAAEGLLGLMGER